MEVREVVETDEVVMEDMDEVEEACERVFEVGELVEFWQDLWCGRIERTAGNLHMLKKYMVWGGMALKWWGVLGVETDE